MEKIMNRIHFFIFSSTSSGTRQFSISKKWFICLSIIFITGTLALGAVIPDYLWMKTIYIRDYFLKSKIITQEEELISQREQIGNFAGQINEMKKRLAFLNEFEKKIRTVANLTMPGHKEVFGVGGSLPEDLDTKLSINNQYSSLVREMHDQTNEILSASLSQEERFDYLLELLEDQRNLLSCTPSIRPVRGWVSSNFGYRTSPFTGKKEFHGGLDIANHEGTKIMAPANGIVAFAGRKGAYGNMIAIDHGYGILTRYGHLKETLVKTGTKVKRGDIIALMGNTGRSTGPHVHYEVRLNGIAVNPNNYILN
ncbi:murein DD-endopeptidase [Candidatus Magnetomoraceae bacterium gMMP-15]